MTPQYPTRSYGLGMSEGDAHESKQKMRGQNLPAHEANWCRAFYFAQQFALVCGRTESGRYIVSTGRRLHLRTHRNSSYDRQSANFCADDVVV